MSIGQRHSGNYDVVIVRVGGAFVRSVVRKVLKAISICVIGFTRALLERSILDRFLISLTVRFNLSLFRVFTFSGLYVLDSIRLTIFFIIYVLCHCNSFRTQIYSILIV